MKFPALILIHGYPFTRNLWDHVIALLDPEIKVLAPDLRPFAGNSLAGTEPSLDLLADDLVALLDEHGISRVLVAGMSMGGYIALSFAERWKARLAGLGLISTQAASDTPEVQKNRREMAERVRREGPLVAAQALLPKMFAPQNEGKPEFTRFALTGAEKAGAEGIVWALHAMAKRPDRTAIARDVKVPTLVLHGAKDQIIPPERARALAAEIPNSFYVEVPQAGHATPLEEPRMVAEALNVLAAKAAGAGSLPAQKAA